MATVVFRKARVGASGTVVMLMFATLTSIGCRGSKQHAYQVAVEYLEKRAPDWKDARQLPHVVTDEGTRWAVTFVLPENESPTAPVVYVGKQRGRVQGEWFYWLDEGVAFLVAVDYIEQVHPDWKDALKLPHEVTDEGDYLVVTFERPETSTGGTPILYLNKHRKRVVKAFHYDARGENTLSKEEAFKIAVDYIEKECPTWRSALVFRRKVVDVGDCWVVAFVLPKDVVGGAPVLHVDKQRRRVVKAFC
jgi:hypothetical protein